MGACCYKGTFAKDLKSSFPLGIASDMWSAASHTLYISYKVHVVNNNFQLEV